MLTESLQYTFYIFDRDLFNTIMIYIRTSNDIFGIWFLCIYITNMYMQWIILMLHTNFSNKNKEKLVKILLEVGL